MFSKHKNITSSMYQFNLNYIWSNWVGPTQLQFIQWIIFLSVGYWSLSSRNDPIFFCSLHWRNLSLYNKITTTHLKQIRFWWKNVIKFRGKVYSNFFKFVQQLFFLSVPWMQCKLLYRSLCQMQAKYNMFQSACDLFLSCICIKHKHTLLMWIAMSVFTALHHAI